MAPEAGNEFDIHTLTTVQKRIMNIGNRVGSIQVQAKALSLWIRLKMS